ncbi:MAG: hypothetical protein GX465_16515 [Acidobacteria bacterium]|nr:hypothetical protein [Acidobacteriota bacterium]
MARDRGYTDAELKEYRDALRASYVARGMDMNDPGIRFVLGEIDEPTLRASLEIPDDWEPQDHTDGDALLSSSGQPTIQEILEESILQIPIRDIRHLREKGINCGYAVTMLVMGCIEVVAEISSATGTTGHTAVNEFFNGYMGRINPRYRDEFTKEYVRPGTRPAKKGDPLPTTPSTLGNLLYSFLRCKLAHDANAIEGFPVEAREAPAHEEMKHLHLTRKQSGGVLIHAYQLFDDFMEALALLLKETGDTGEPSERLRKHCLRYQQRLRMESEGLLNILASGVKK